MGSSSLHPWRPPPIQHRRRSNARHPWRPPTVSVPTAEAKKDQAREVDLTDIAAQQQRPIEELQRTFRAAREPVEQAKELSIPAGAEIKRAPAPGLLEKVGNVFRRGAIGRGLGLSDVAAQAQAARPTAEPTLRLSELMPGRPTATVSLPRYPGRFGPPVIPGERQPSAHETVEFPIGGVAKGTLEVAEALTTPENVAIIASLGLTAGALPLLSRIISAGFSIELLRGVVQQYPELREAMNTGDEQRAAQVATRMGLGGILSALAGAHAVRGRAPTTRTVEPEVRAPAPRLAPGPVRRALPPVRGPEIGIERELPTGGVVRPVPPPVEPLVAAAPAMAPAPGLRAPVAAPSRARRARRPPQPAPEQQRAAAAWERVLREEAPPPKPPAPKPLPAGITEELVQGELLQMKSRGLGQDRPTAIATVERMQRRQAEAEAAQPLPEPQPVSPREAAELGVAPERVPEVLRRQREAEGTAAEAARRQPRRPAPILEERGLAPAPGLRRPQPVKRVLPGMERAVREQGEAARRLEGEKLGEEFATPVEERAGKPIETAPIFRGTEAAPQREMFAPQAGKTELELLGARESGGIINLRFGPESEVTKGTIERMLKGFNVEVTKQKSLHTQLGADPRMVQSFEISVWDEANRLSPALAQRALQERLGGAQRFTTEPIRKRLEKAGVLKQRTVVDEFGDTIERGGHVVDSLGRSGKVRSVGALVQDLETGKAVFREDTLKVDFGKGPVPVSIAEVTVKRHGRPKALEGIGRKPVRYFGETDIAFHERLLRGPETPEGGMYANPVFSPRFWERADAAVSATITKPLTRALENALGKLPAGVQRWLRTDFGRFPEVKRIFQESRLEIGQVRNEAEALRRMWLRTKATPEETVAAEGILRGHPQDLNKLRPEQQEVVKEIQDSAQRLTAERQALGLPVREEWLEGPKHWYPNFFRQHLGQWIGGKLFGRIGRMRPSKEALGSLRPRLTDRFWIADSTGKVVETAPGTKAIFESRQAAESFIQENSGYWITYFEKGSRRLKTKNFPKLKKRTAWIKQQGENITPRKLDATHYQLVEPMTFEQMVANGLVLDPALNVARGWSQQAELIAKTRFLSKLGEMEDVLRDSPTEGYVSLGEAGFHIASSLAERNSAIARLRDGFVKESLARELAAFYGPDSPFFIAYRVSEGALRKWVTYRNPWRHPRQIFENELTTALTDSGAFLDKIDQGRAFYQYAKAGGGDTSVPYWKEYANSELIYTDLIRGEFQTMWRGLSEATHLNPSAPLSFTERLALWAEQNPVARRLLQTDEFAQRAYRAEDQIYKWYRYSRYRNQGWKHEAAVKRVKDSYFNYGDVPVIVRKANRVIPFWINVSFQYSRIFANQLRDYPASTMLRLSLLWYGQAFVREMMLRESGLTDQDLKNMGKYGPRSWDFVLPWTDDKGKNLVLDLRWLIPFSEVTLMRYAAVEEEPERGWTQLARRVMPMVAQPIATAVTQTTAFGRKVLTGVETRAEAAWKLARAAALSALPALLGQYWARLYRNAQAGEERKQSWWEKILVEPATGRLQRFHPEERIGLRKALTAGKARKVQEEAGRQRGRFIRGTTSAETFREEVGKLRTRITQEGVAHPETVAVLDALERGGDERTQAAYQRLLAEGSRISRETVQEVIVELLELNTDASAAFRSLARSGFYRTPEEAFEALVDIQRRKARLTELEQTPLPEARSAAQAAVDELRRTGQVTTKTGRELEAALEPLSESDQNKLLDWLEEQMRIQRRRRQPSAIPRGNLAPAPGVPRTPQANLAPAPGL